MSKKNQTTATPAPPALVPHSDEEILKMTVDSKATYGRKVKEAIARGDVTVKTRETASASTKTEVTKFTPAHRKGWSDKEKAQVGYYVSTLRADEALTKLAELTPRLVADADGETEVVAKAS